MIIAILLLAIGIWQCYSSIKYFKHLKTEAGQTTSPFSMLAIFSGSVFGIALVVSGFYIIFS